MYTILRPILELPAYLCELMLSIWEDAVLVHKGLIADHETASFWLWNKVKKEACFFAANFTENI